MPSLTLTLALALPLTPLVALALGTSAGQAAPPFSPAVRAGDFVYLSGALPTAEDGKVVAGDIKVQTRRVLDNLARVALANGTRIERAASVTVYLRRAADFAAMNEVYRARWPVDPPARTTVVADLVAPEALVEIAMVAIVDGAERRVINPSEWAPAANPYSYGILSGDTLFTSGLLSRRGTDNTVVTGDVSAQTRVVLGNAGDVLRAAGMTLADVVTARVYLTDAANFQAMNVTYREAFPGVPPSRATVQVGLTAPPYLVEIAMVAVRSESREAVTTPGPDGRPGAPSANLSSAIRVGDRLFLSGMVGATEATRGDVAAQTRETLARLGRTLSAAGFAWADVVESTVYLTDVANFAAMNGVYQSAIPSPWPARATVRTGLVGPDGLVEIAMTAARKR